MFDANLEIVIITAGSCNCTKNTIYIIIQRTNSGIIIYLQTKTRNTSGDTLMIGYRFLQNVNQRCETFSMINAIQSVITTVWLRFQFYCNVKYFRILKNNFTRFNLRLFLWLHFCVRSVLVSTTILFSVPANVSITAFVDVGCQKLLQFRSITFDMK